MTDANTSPRRVIVCGTKFGRAYLAAFDPATRSFPGFELAGILARGSARSLGAAKHYGVPLYTEASEVPDDVDIVCVVVGSSVNGGRGAELAETFLSRGIHVLQEHPLHAAELTRCLRAAHRSHVVYLMNTHYVHVPQVARFIRIARSLLGQQRALYLDAACSFQVAYTLLDILAAITGAVRPWAFLSPPTPSRELASGDVPFRSIDGVFAGIPLTLRVQNQMDPSDPDNHAHLFHRVTIGTEGGNLTLHNTYGPILWCPRPYMPFDMRETATMDASTAPHFEWPSASTVGPDRAPSYRDVLSVHWPQGVRHALCEMALAIDEQIDSRVRGQVQLSLCQMWAEIAGRLGPVELITRRAPELISDAALAGLAQGGTP